MSLAGFKKQINKANQFMSEKLGGAKGTELDDDFLEMERKTDIMEKLVDELMARTHELMQPNPASRAKLTASRGISKLRGQANSTLYPQPEGLLGDCMLKYGNELGDDSIFGQSLVETGEVYKRLAEEKYTLEDGIKQNFIEPFNQLQSKDLKEVNFHRKKLSGRRLDYDCKKRKKDKGGATVPEEEIRQAEEKFVESKELAEVAMFNLLSNDVEQVTALLAFIEAEVDYHRHCADHLQSLVEVLKVKRDEAGRRPRQDHIPKRATSTSDTYSNRSSSPTPGYEKQDSKFKEQYKQDTYDSYNSNAYNPPSYGASASSSANSSQQPCCEALYDFDPENEGELGFREGERITLLARIDDNWYEGSVHGQTGLFPVNYVKIITPLPR